MPKFHFVEDYERLVADLIATHPLNEAMSLAVGGNYDVQGPQSVDILEHHGVRDGVSIVDFGCGSGRVAKYLGIRFPGVSYTGIDVVQALLDYASRQCPKHFRFMLNHDIALPLEPDSADFFVAFSVFTHLLHEETYLYMAQARRALKRGGKLVFSFLEFGAPHHWEIFRSTVATRREHVRYHMNTFIEPVAIRLWADWLGFSIISIGPCALGQSLAVLENSRRLPAGFEVARYLELNPDVKDGGWPSPADHWHRHGYMEGRRWM